VVEEDRVDVGEIDEVLDVDRARALRLMRVEFVVTTITLSPQERHVLLQILSQRNPELGTHLDEVTQLCEAVGQALAVPEDQMNHLLHAAALHDVGKAAIPEAILDKAGPLDDDEWAYIRRHTIMGERILAAAPALAPAAKLVRSSHERVDGRGYPDDLAGDQIPLGARIIAPATPTTR